MIRDALAMMGASTPDELRQRWKDLVASGQVDAERLQPLKVTLDAYVNHGRWVCDCVCNGGIACSPDMTDGACLDCGCIFAIRFPAPKVRREGETALGPRPVPQRNWYPSTETPARLRAETELLTGVVH